MLTSHAFDSKTDTGEMGEEWVVQLHPGKLQDMISDFPHLIDESRSLLAVHSIHRIHRIHTPLISTDGTSHLCDIQPALPPSLSAPPVGSISAPPKTSLPCLAASKPCVTRPPLPPSEIPLVSIPHVYEILFTRGTGHHRIQRLSLYVMSPAPVNPVSTSPRPAALQHPPMCGK